MFRLICGFPNLRDVFFLVFDVLHRGLIIIWWTSRILGCPQIGGAFLGWLYRDYLGGYRVEGLGRSKLEGAFLGLGF